MVQRELLPKPGRIFQVITVMGKNMLSPLCLELRRITTFLELPAEGLHLGPRLCDRCRERFARDLSKRSV